MHDNICSLSIPLCAALLFAAWASPARAGDFEGAGALKEGLQAVNAGLQSYGASRAGSVVLSKAEQKAVLRAIDDHCGDTWCEGGFEFVFQDFSCAPAPGGTACALEFLMSKDEEANPAGCTVVGLKAKTDIIAGVSGGSIELAEGFLDKLDACVAGWEKRLSRDRASSAAGSGKSLICEFQKGSADAARPAHSVKTVTMAEATRHEEAFGSLSGTVQFAHGRIIQAMIFDRSTGAMAAESFDKLASSGRASLHLQDIRSGDYLGLECRVASAKRR